MASAQTAAAHIFIGIARFRELVEQGAITKQAPGNYDLDLVRKEAFAHLRRDRGGHGTADLSKQRSELAHEQTLAVKFKNQLLRGDYVSLIMIRKAGEAMLTVFRERILSIPGKISDKLAMRTREECDLILREELNEALDELSNAAFGGSSDLGHVSGDGPGRPAAAQAQPDRMG